MPPPAFSPPPALPPRPRARRALSSARRPPTAQVTTVSDRQLTALAAAPGVVVLKCFALHCAGCRGVEPKFRKIAAAYHAAHAMPTPVAFCQIDYARYEAFCKTTLGVRNLPFFGIFRDGKYVGGEAIGWQSVAKKLVENIDLVLADDMQHSHVFSAPAPITSASADADN